MENEREKHSRLAKKPKKTKKRSRFTRFQKFLMVITVILALVLAGVLAMQGMFVKPELGGKLPGKEDKENQIDWGEGTRPRAEGTRKSQDFYTILIVGRDTGGGGNTDTMLLASYDVTNQKAAVMSLPRDTMVNVSWDVKKLNSVYNANGKGEKGIKALYKEIAQLVGFEPDYQVVVEWEAVGAIVDAIGGVWFDNPYPMDYHDPNQNLVIEQAPGYRLLTGEDAMQVIRWRKNDRDSRYGYNTGGVGDVGRMELQQDFLKAVITQLLRPENVMNIGKIIKVFQQNVETDLTFQNILWFAQQAVKGGLTADSVEFFTMPWKGASAYSRTESKRLGKYVTLSYVVPRPQELLDLVNNHLSPYQEVFTLSDLDIMSVNKDGTISSTTGRVEDQRATVPPKRPAVEPKPDPNAPIEGNKPDDVVVDPANPDIPTDIEEGPDAPLPEEPGSQSGGTVPEQPQQPQQPQTEQPQQPIPQPTEPPAPVEPNPPADSGFQVIDPDQAA